MDSTSTVSSSAEVITKNAAMETSEQLDSAQFKVPSPKSLGSVKWETISEETITSSKDLVTIKVENRVGLSSDKAPIPVLSVICRPRNGPQWQKVTICLNKKEMEWFKMNSGDVLSRKLQHFECAKVNDIATRYLVTEGVQRRGEQFLLIKHRKLGGPESTLLIPANRIGGFICSISAALDKQKEYVTKAMGENADLFS